MLATTMRSKSFAERIADVLIEDGLLLPNQLEEAVGIQQKEGGRLLKILTDRQFVTDQDMTVSMGRCLNTPLINLSKLRVPEEVMSLVPRDMAKANKLIPIARLNGKLFVAMADPTNVLAVDDVKRRVQLEIVPMIATEKAVSDALAGVHGASNMSQVLKQVAEDVANAGEVEVQSAKNDEIDLDRLATDSEDAPVIKIVNLILVQAVKEKASDIHIEPFQRTLKLRYRIDGELIMAESPPKALQLAITSRIKILSGLNIAERRVPQDGRFRIKVIGKEVDLRVSILPTAYGEKIVIRILDKAALTGSIDQMGMDQGTLDKFKKGDRRAARNDSRDRPDGFRQNDDALLGAAGAEQPAIQHRDGRGPDRVRAHGHQSGLGAQRHRSRFRLGASLHPSAGSGHRDGG